MSWTALLFQKDQVEKIRCEKDAVERITNKCYTCSLEIQSQSITNKIKETWYSQMASNIFTSIEAKRIKQN